MKFQILWNCSTVATAEFSKFAGILFSSVAQSCPTLCDPMNHIMPGLRVHHQLLESTKTHLHCVSDAIQPSHPLSSSSRVLNLSPHQDTELSKVTPQCQLCNSPLEIQLFLRLNQGMFSVGSQHDSGTTKKLFFWF